MKFRCSLITVEEELSVWTSEVEVRYFIRSKKIKLTIHCHMSGKNQGVGCSIISSFKNPQTPVGHIYTSANGQP